MNRQNLEGLDITLNTSLASLEFSDKIVTEMKKRGIVTLKDLLNLSLINSKYNEKNLFNIPGIDKKSGQKIINFIHRLGFSFKYEVQPSLNCKISDLNISEDIDSIFLDKTIAEILTLNLNPNSPYTEFYDTKSKETSCNLLINFLHCYGFVFEFEKNPSLDTKIRNLAMGKQLDSKFQNKAIYEILMMDLDPKSSQSIYKNCQVEEASVQDLINVIHLYGYQFYSIYEKKGIAVKATKKNVSNDLEYNHFVYGLRKINLETKIFELDNFRVLHPIFWDKTIRFLLQLDLSPDASVSNSVYRYSEIKEEHIQKLKDFIHDLRFKFDYEKQNDLMLTKDSKITDLNFSYPITMQLLKNKIDTVDDLLSLLIKPNPRPSDVSIYNVAELQQDEIEQIIEHVHHLRLKFYSETEMPLSNLQVQDSIWRLKLPLSLLRKLKQIPVNKIDDLLSLPINDSLEGYNISIYNITPKEVTKIIDYIHSLGFLFKNEDSRYIIKKECAKLFLNNDGFSLEKLLANLNADFVLNHFYNKIDKLSDVYDNEFAKQFVSVIAEQGYVMFQEEEIWGFLRQKLIKRNQNLRKISCALVEQLEQKNVMILKRIFKSVDETFVRDSFYDAILEPNDIYQNEFVKYFKNLAKISSDFCLTDEEILNFLRQRLLEHKKKTLKISAILSDELDLKRKNKRL